MTQDNPQPTRTLRVKAGRRRIAIALGSVAAAAFMAVLSWSAVTAFQRHTEPVPLAATESNRPNLGERPAPRFEIETPATTFEEVGVGQTTKPAPATATTARRAAADSAPAVKHDRYGNVIVVNGKPWTGEVFDFRPIRPVRAQIMKTTAYSPDERSCGKWADGITASGKSVWMNGGRLVAADRKIPYGTILTIPGYNHGKPVQVWDRGGKIKGNRLDVLYPTHEIARRWGVQDLRVVFWEFVEAD